MFPIDQIWRRSFLTYCLSGNISISALFWFCLFRQGLIFFPWASLKVLGLHNPLASVSQVAGITSLCHSAFSFEGPALLHRDFLVDSVFLQHLGHAVSFLLSPLFWLRNWVIRNLLPRFSVVIFKVFLCFWLLIYVYIVEHFSLSY